MSNATYTFDSNNWDSIKDTIKKICDADHIIIGETTEGETIVFDTYRLDENSDRMGLHTTVFQSNGWQRDNYYDPVEGTIDETYKKGTIDMMTFMNPKRVNVEYHEASQLCISLPDDVDLYAKYFLALFNGIQCNNELISLYKLDGTTRVFLTLEDSAVDAFTEYAATELTHCKIIEKGKVLVAEIIDQIDYDIDKYEDLVVAPYESDF